MMNTCKDGMIRAVLMMVILLVSAGPAIAAIQGVTGTTFNLTAKADYISTAEGNSVYMWGYALNNGTMQYPGPTLIVNEGANITINLKTDPSVPMATSIVFPGQSGMTATGGAQGLITREAANDGTTTVTYTFKALKPGTYTYYSGTRPDLQIEMGLVGTLIVRPAGYNATTNKIAYNHADSAYDHEYLFFISEIDINIHLLAEAGLLSQIDNAAYWPVYWLLNGRTAPDTMSPANASWLPTQPYNCIPMAHPGEKILIRWVGGGRDPHPYHTHGNHHKVIARDGRMLSSVPGGAADLAEVLFTSTVVPGGTIDAVWTWTGEKLGWDIYGPIDSTCIDENNDGIADGSNPPAPCHDAKCIDINVDGFDDATTEYCADHGKPIPVQLPSQQDLTFGQFYSGSPYLGGMGALPPGEGGFNPNGGFLFMWHSHAEKELTNFDIFPGGMLTMMILEHSSVTLVNP